MARKRQSFEALVAQWASLAETFNYVSATKVVSKPALMKVLKSNGVLITPEWWTAYVKGGLIQNLGFSKFSLTFLSWESKLEVAYNSYYPNTTKVVAKPMVAKMLSEYSDEELLRELKRRHPGNEVMCATDTHYPVMVPYGERITISYSREVFRAKK